MKRALCPSDARRVVSLSTRQTARTESTLMPMRSAPTPRPETVVPPQLLPDASFADAATESRARVSAGESAAGRGRGDSPVAVSGFPPCGPHEAAIAAAVASVAVTKSQ
jgi:hypothetical protein